MRAVKGNKEYTIDEVQQKGYQDMGFDILSDDGNVIAYGRGKTAPYDEYMKVKQENESLKQEIESLKKQIANLNAPKEETPKQETPKKAESKKAGE